MLSMTTTSPELDPPPAYELLAPITNTVIHTDAATPIRDKHHLSEKSSPFSFGQDRWLYHQDSPLIGFWVRGNRINSSIPHTSFEDLAQIHFGISDDQNNNKEKPDCFFSCSLLPRTSTTSKTDIARFCGKIARAARRHRLDSPGYCECTFEDLRDGLGCDKGGGCPWYYRVLGWFAAWQTRRFMRQHDEMCRCRCFDTYLTNSGLPL